MGQLSPSTIVCDRVRAQVSLQLDGELAELERRMLAAHLERCAECAAYADDLEQFTYAIRSAPLERLERPVVIERRRRLSGVRLQVAAAAGLAVAALGLGTQLASTGSHNSSFSSYQGTRDLNPPRSVLEREQAMIHAVRPGVILPPPGSVL